MILPLWYIVIFIVCLAITSILMIFSMKKYGIRTPNDKIPKYIKDWPYVIQGKYDTNHAPEISKPYSMKTRMISGLGNLLYSSAPFFNSMVKIFGIMIFPLGIFTYLAFGNLLSGWSLIIFVLGVVGFEIGCLGIFLLGIYTENRHFKHGIVAALAFGGYTAAIVFWIPAFLIIEMIPNWILIFHMIPILMFVYHGIAVRNFDLHEQMQDILPPNWKVNYNWSEWLLFFAVCAWIIVLFTLFSLTP